MMEENLLAKALFDGVVGAVAGGIVGATITVIVEGKRKRREMSVKILERMVASFHSLGQVMALLRVPGVLNADPVKLNAVLEMGNWFDIVAAMSAEKIADGDILEAIGVKAQFLDFLKAVEGAAGTVPKLETALAQDWKRLVAFTNFTYKR